MINFDIFKGIDENYTIKVVPGNETDPLNLVKQTIERAKELRLVLDDDDRAFCILDTDVNPSKNTQIKEAIELAHNNIKVITSSPCIEIWFLLHYEYTTVNMNSDNAIIQNILRVIICIQDNAKKLEK